MESVVSVEDDYHNITHKSVARGPFVYSILDGDALTAMEHLEFCGICG